MAFSCYCYFLIGGQLEIGAKTMEPCPARDSLAEGQAMTQFQS